MLKIDLKEQERAELQNLDIHLERNLQNLDYLDRIDEMIAETKKIKSDFLAGKITSEQELQENVKRLLGFAEESKNMKVEKDTLPFPQIVERTKTLTETAIKRALKYYDHRIDELVTDIKENIRQSIYTASTLHMDDDPLWKEHTLELINSYLEFLKIKAPERYKEVIDSIQYAFSNQDEIIREAQEKSKRNTSELGLYTANPLSIMFSGKITHTLGKLKTVGKIDPIRKSADVSGVKIISQNISQMGVGEAKIFRYAIAAFTQKNSRGTSSQQLHLRVFLSLNDYARVTNTDISTKDRLKNFKKKLKKNLDNLLQKNITFSWSEDIKGKTKNYGGISLISGYNIKGEAITIDFSLGLAEYLVSLPTLVEYPRALYSVNDRNFNAFAIGEAMFQHYSINNNIIRGTEQVLSVQKILEVTSFPSYEKVKEEKHSWEFLIKEQLEKALDHLHTCSFLRDWCYSQAKGRKLTDEEASQITSYEKFVSLYIWYELTDYPEHSKRADIIIEAKAKSIEKTKRRKPKPKPKE